MGKYKDVLAVPDDYVPTDHNDLVKKYDKFVALLVRRYNQVTTNYADLLQHVWMKLIEVKVIEKYQRSGGSLPKQLTGEQAAAYLQMNFASFKVSIWRFLLGDYRKIGGVKAVSSTIVDAVTARDKGVCGLCGKDCTAIENALAMYRLESLEKYTEKRQALFHRYGIPVGREKLWVVSRKKGVASEGPEGFQTACLFCCERNKSEWAPTPLTGGWSSAKATYAREDIERYRIVREAKSRTKAVAQTVDPIVYHTKSLFKLYLARAVHNIYANWCRTRSRRYKEIYPGTNEEGQSWDYNIMDNHAQPEDLVSLYRAVKLAASGEEDIRDVDFGSKSNEAREVQFLGLLAEGYTLPEVVTKMSLPRSVLRTIST